MTANENWRTTPEENVFDRMYVALAKSEGDDVLVPDFYGVTEDRPEPVFHVLDEQGHCWRVRIDRHVHNTPAYRPVDLHKEYHEKGES